MVRTRKTLQSRIHPQLGSGGRTQPETKANPEKNGADDYLTKPFALQKLEKPAQAAAARPADVRNATFTP